MTRQAVLSPGITGDRRSAPPTGPYPADSVKKDLAELERIAAHIGRALSFMEVCGTHTMSAFRCGLAGVLPDNIRLISGPGCPVCVTSQADIDQIIAAAHMPDVILCTYGDMLRVPGSRGSLESARMAGADVRVVYSAMHAVTLAQSTTRQVIFAAVGFETTAPATAAAVMAARRLNLNNFSVLTSHKRIIPAMCALLSSAPVDAPCVDGFLAPGHVSVIIGTAAYLPIVRDFHKSCVIGGFEPPQIISALTQLAQLAGENKAELLNHYPEAVRPEGNLAAQQLLNTVFEPAAARWRGLGVIDQSGLILRMEYADFDARRRHQLCTPEDHEPRGCICGRVISGAAAPGECPLFGSACTPVNPIGPCMVSSEGTCSAWFKYLPNHVHPNRGWSNQEVCT